MEDLFHPDAALLDALDAQRFSFPRALVKHRRPLLGLHLQAIWILVFIKPVQVILKALGIETVEAKFPPIKLTAAVALRFYMAKDRILWDYIFHGFAY